MKKSKNAVVTKDQVKTKIIATLVNQMFVFGEESVPKEMLVKCTGYTHENTKGFCIPFSELKKDNIVDVSSKKVRLTEKGKRYVPRDAGPPKDNAEARERFLAVLEKTVKASSKLEQLWDILSDGKSHQIDHVIATLGYKHANSKGYSEPKSAMVKLKLIETAGKGAIRFTDKAFPSGRP